MLSKDTKDSMFWRQLLEDCEDQIRNLCKVFAPGALNGDMTKFKDLIGSNLLERVNPYFEWQDNIRKSQLWYFEKVSSNAIDRFCTGFDDSGRKIQGVNFASQDYLSFLSNFKIRLAAKTAVDCFGVHSAGSPALFGNTGSALELERIVGKFVRMEHVALFPTGWGAGCGIIKALIRPGDFVVMDKLSHACLQEGAGAATENIFRFKHLDNSDVEKFLRDIRMCSRNYVCTLLVTY